LQKLLLNLKFCVEEERGSAYILHFNQAAVLIGLPIPITISYLFLALKGLVCVLITNHQSFFVALFVIAQVSILARNNNAFFFLLN
jgi:hypothetical protein